MIKIQWLASIGCQNNQNKAKAKQQKWSKSNDLHWFDVKTINNVEIRRKTFKTTQNYKTEQITMNWCQNDQNKAKLQKWSKSNNLHRLDVKTIKTKLKLNYKSDQNPMTCIDLTSKRSKMLSYVIKHSKQRKTTKPIKIQYLASIWRQNDQSKAKAKLQKWSKSNDLHRLDVKTIKNKAKAKLQKWSKSNDLHRFDAKTVKNVELRRKTFKTTQNYKTDQNPMSCIDLTSKWSKMLSDVAKHSKQRKTTKPIKLQWIASIRCQNVQNKAKLASRASPYSAIEGRSRKCGGG